MLAKIKAILKSIRFWEVVVATVLFALIEGGIIDNETAVLIARIIATTLGISVTIGTVDKVASNFSRK